MKTIIRKVLRILPDSIYIRMMFRKNIGYWPDLNNPQSFNEKLQWLKLHNRKPEFTDWVDKIKVKKYVAGIIGDEYIIPTLQVWDNVDDIDIATLPNQFVLKCNHDSYSAVVCNDKSTLDVRKTLAFMKKHLKNNFYWYGREWPYKNVEAKVFAEKYISDESNNGLNDYKILCFNGVAKYIEVHKDRFGELHTQDLYDRDWHLTSITQGPTSKKLEPKPRHLEKMIEFSETLSQNIPHLRVDWYIADDRLYFGEITFFDGSGFARFDNMEDDMMLGSLITL